MTELLPLLAAALAAGFLGSAHCLGMCSGMSGLFAANAVKSSLKQNSTLALGYNLGRLSSYSLLGALTAAAGGKFVDLVPSMAVPVRLISGILIILVGLQVAFRWPALALIERAGASIWQHFAPAAGGLLPVTNLRRAMALGLLWGWLPCGLVYSLLLTAATTATPLNGALVMLAFGAGTLPAMLMTGLGAAHISLWLGRNHVSAGLLIVVLGIATLATPLDSLLSATGGHSGHH